jgi:acetoin utilization deacetylase AcuC-like enzyme
MHGEHNFLFRKQPSTRDVGLPDGTGDAGYLDALAPHLPEVLDTAGANLLFVQAGVDPLVAHVGTYEVALAVFRRARLLSGRLARAARQADAGP